MLYILIILALALLISILLISYNYSKDENIYDKQAYLVAEYLLLHSNK